MTVLRRRVLAGWLIVLSAILVTRGGLADGRTAFLIDHLKADDFRVRAQAALALGAADDDAVVSPLCDTINDQSDVVRQAVAAALKRLGRTSALGCLRNRAGVESNSSVKQQISRAIEAIEASGGGGGQTRVVPNAKFYVALSPLTNNTGRSQADVERVVMGAIRSKLDSLGAYQIAPPSESPDDARATIAKRKLKAYYLSILVEKFDYSDGNLRVRVKVAVFTYPSKDLRGEVPAGLTQTGVRPGDHAAEENLMSMAAGRAVELFAQNFQ
jgi:hypothetical protein